MSVPTNLIPTLITGLQEYTGSSTLGYMPYILDGRTYKVQFANIAAVGAVPSSRVIAAGTGLAGGGDLSANRVISIANGGVGFDQLALSGVTQGTYGSGSAIPILTVDSKGRITSATTAPLDVTGFVPTSRTITAGDGLTGGGALTSNVTLAANFSAATPSALGTASAGTAITVSRGDHVHPAVNLSDTSQTQGALPLGRGGTGDALSPVAGAVVYSTGSKFALTNPGIAGQVLVSAGTDEPQWQTILGTGTVTSVSVSTANGFAGFVANPATVPDITLSTTVTGMLKGDGTGMSAATAGVDYVEPGPYTTSGLTMASARLLGRTTASVGAAQEITVGTGLTLSSGSLVNAAPDQTVSLTAGTAISVTGTYPSFTVTNTAPDQVVSLTGAGTTTVTGTYPSFTITSNDSTSGTVTSVNASGGTTGMSFTGGPVTSAGTLTLNGTLAVANGGTGATDAATALTNLGAYPASNPAGYTTNVGTVTSVSGTGTVSGLSLSGTVTSAGSLTLGGTLAVTPSDFASQTANTVLAAPNGSAGVPTFRNLVAADVPTLNQNTTGTASNVTGIVAVANGGTGASVAGTARTNLGAAASGANTDITSIALTTGTISTSPVNGTDIVNKAYADSIASGINFHQSVRLATAAALPANTYNNGTSGVGATLTANANGALSVDGVAVAVGNRILVKNEAAQANNGVYVVTDTGSSGGPGPGPGGSNPYILTRATDFDSSGSGVDQIDAGDFFLVTAGSTLANTSWVQQTPLPITVGTTAIVFSQFAAPVLYSAGTGLSLTGTTFSITNTGVSASTYGSASSVPVIAVNAQGQITSASASSIAIAASQITSGALAIANGGTGATSAATALTNLGAYPASNPSGFTSNTGTVTSVNLTAGTGVSVSGGPITASGSITVTNTAPDQVVSLTGSGATTVTGTYPNFTISSTAGGAGTVTSIDVSGGTTGLTTSGGPVTSSGTITLAGTLNVANGGTGATTLSSGYVLKGNGTSAVSASVIYDDGTNAGIGTTSPGARLETYQSSGGTNAIRMNTNFASGNYVDFNPSISGVSNGGYSISLNGTIRQVISYTGDAGFGTSSPAAKLEINGGTAMTSGWNRSLMLSATYPVLVLNSNNTKYSGIGVDFGSAPAGMYFWVNGSSSDLSGTGTIAMSINTGNYVEAYGSFRAPIYYDSNNTAYYLNPETTSVVNTVQYGINYTSGGGGGRIIPSTGSPYSLRQEFGSDNSGWRYGIAKNVSGTVTTLFYVEDNGSVLATGDFRAPIFYDSDNTGYYINPTGISIIKQINVGTGLNVYDEAAVSPDPYGLLGITRKTDDNYSYLGFTRAGQHAMGMGIDTGNTFWIGGCSSGFNGVRTSSWLLMHTSGYVTAPVDMRAPIFYDSNNTAFYANMDGTSEFNTIQTRGGSGFRSFATPSASINSQIYFADAGNTRAWNWQLDENNNAALWSYGGSSWGKRLGVTHNSEMFLRNSSGTDISVAYPSTFGYSSAYRTMILGNQAYTTVCIGVDPVANPSGSFNGAGSGVEVMFKNGVGFITPNSANNGYLNVMQMTDGVANFTAYATAAGSFRAPIFYDSDNTGYYLDPNSSGLALRTSGYWIADSTAWAGDINGKIQYHGNNWYFSAADSWIFRASNGTQPFYVGQTGVAIASGDMRAPIFYDNNNTAYYVDPNSVSNLADLRAPNVVHYPGWPGSPGIDANAYGFNAISSFTYSNNAPWTGPFVSFAAGGYNLQLNAPYGGSGAALSYRTRNGDTSTFNSWYLLASYGANPGAGDLYAAIYYDANNTGYYINPNGTSNIYQLTGAITYGSYGSFSASGTYNGYAGIAFPDVSAALMMNQGGSGFYFNNNTWGMYCNSSGSMYSRIFYDLNDTGYYCDPTGTSVFAGLTVSNIINGFVTGCTFAEDSVSKDDIATRSDSGFYQSSSGTTAEGWPINDGNWQHMISCTHTNDGNYFAMQLGASFFSQGLFYRSVANSGTQAWSRVALYDNGYAAPLYASIYYDADNTAYYLDPASTGTSLNVAGNLDCIARSAAWSEGLRVRVPTRATWGGVRFTRDEANSNGNWAIGYTGIDSTDDLTFWGNLSGAEGMRARLTQTGDFTATGNVTAYSDARLKENVETIANALELVGQMRGVTYNRKDSGKAGVGVIAQEMREIIPEVVVQDGSEDGTLSVAYGNLVGVLIEAIKELTARVAELEGK